MNFESWGGNPTLPLFGNWNKLIYLLTKKKRKLIFWGVGEEMRRREEKRGKGNAGEVDQREREMTRAVWEGVTSKAERWEERTVDSLSLPQSFSPIST